MKYWSILALLCFGCETGGVVGGMVTAADALMLGGAGRGIQQSQLEKDVAKAAVSGELSSNYITACERAKGEFAGLYIGENEYLAGCLNDSPYIHVKDDVIVRTVPLREINMRIDKYRCEAEFQANPGTEAFSNCLLTLAQIRSNEDVAAAQVQATNAAAAASRANARATSAASAQNQQQNSAFFNSRTIRCNSQASFGSVQTNCRETQF